jgi:uncharacterized membrane protein
MDTKSSRLVTTTLLGAIFGVICMLMSRYGGSEVAFWPLGVSFLLHHTVLGIAIGASSLKINWAAHGAFWGVLFGLFLAIGQVGGALQPWMAFILPVIWGFLIEALATKAFKQPQYR